MKTIPERGVADAIPLGAVGEVADAVVVVDGVADGVVNGVVYGVVDRVPMSVEDVLEVDI
jgi:hypothetical protein